MKSSSKKDPKTITLFVESPNGVSEYIVGLMQVDETPIISPLAARVVSGEGTGLSLTNLQEALELQHWALTHADVLKEGRVVKDS
jgi:hypothetical protein